MDKNFKPPKPRQMFAPEPLSVRLRAWRPTVMQLAIAVSVSLHAAVLGVRFVDPEDFNRVFQDTPLEVVLVNARSTEAPTKAQAIAQANLAGGGEGRGRHRHVAAAAVAQPDHRRRPDRRVAPDRADAADAAAQILAQVRRDVAAMPVPDPRKGAQTSAEREQEERRQQKLRQLAVIEKQINEQNARPRRRYISPATREEVYAIYYDKLRHKIEDKGTANFPDAQRPQAVRRAHRQPHDRRARPHRRLRGGAQLQLALPGPTRAGHRPGRRALRQASATT